MQRFGIWPVLKPHTSNLAAQKQYGWFLEAAPEDIAYLAELPFSLSLPSHGVLVVHAGLVPGVPLQRQALYDLIEVRALTP